VILAEAQALAEDSGGSDNKSDNKEE
jgi:hypothetical protein